MLSPNSSPNSSHCDHCDSLHYLQFQRQVRGSQQAACYTSVKVPSAGEPELLLGSARGDDRAQRHPIRGLQRSRAGVREQSNMGRSAFQLQGCALAFDAFFDLKLEANVRRA